MPVRRARLPATTKIVPATGSEHESESGPGSSEPRTPPLSGSLRLRVIRLPRKRRNFKFAGPA
jgi:hypothetical protein